MKNVFLFPGQGSQYVGMGLDLYNNYDCSKKIYDHVCDLTDIDIKSISFEENNLINETKYTQLAILTHSLAICEILKEKGIRSSYSAGLSLGEYSALIDSRIINFSEGIKLVKNRGYYMQEFVPENNYKMVAVMGLNDDVIENVCNEIEGVYPANYNSYGQVVISGLDTSVDKAIELLKENGGKVIPLNTSGPFHTKFLEKSAELLKEDLQDITFNKGESIVIKNLDGLAYKEDDDYVSILSNHIINPIRFTKVIETMLNEGVNTFVEIGPGKSLSNLVKKINKVHNKEIKIFNIQDMETLENTLKELGE